ncbi:TPA: hypothetical protein ACNDLL_004195 [Shigella sonnei]|jgi:hypothetical protein
MIDDEYENDYIKQQIEDFENSAFGKFFKNKKLQEQELIYLNNKALDIINEEDLFEIMSLIPQPFIVNDKDDNLDVLSVIYNKFLENTEIPLSLPIFGFFSFLSAYCVKNNITYTLPLSDDKSPCDTWITVLAPSGSAKTFSIGQIKKVIPTDLDGKKLIEQNFTKPNGPAKFIEELSNLPKTKDGKSQYGFWIEDEVAQMFKQIEQIGSPLSEIKEYLLKAYDHEKLSRKSKKETIETDNLVLTLLFINTFESYVNNISQESMTDGLMRRFNLVYTEKDERRDFTKFALYDIKKIRDQTLEKKVSDFFYSIEGDKSYTFSKDCYYLYTKYFKIFWDRKYKNILTNKENFYRTYMMQSWKFAVFYHLILKREGTEIQGDCLIFGMKISLLFANSMKKFFDFKIRKNIPDKKIEKIKTDLTKYIDFLENNPEATLREFSRKYTLKKANAIAVLKSLQCANIQHKLIEELE